jgi:hypothetical protein
MSGTEGIMGRFTPLRETGQPAKSTLRMKAVTATGDDLVSICLMTDIPDETVFGGSKAVVEGKGQFDYTEVRSEVPSGFRDGFKEKNPQFPGKCFKLFYGELLEVGWTVYSVK